MATIKSREFNFYYMKLLSNKFYEELPKEIFLSKLPKFLELYENLEKNGHIKLQIVACLC